MDSPADAVIDLYERQAGAWVAARLREAHLYERGWLDKFRGLMRAGGAVLDLGCGAGAPIAQYLAGHGHAMTGVDSSKAMIALFRARLPASQALVSDMRRLSLGSVFDGILAWDSFFHLAPDDQRLMFPIFRAHAAAGAALMFTSGPKHGEAIGSLEGEPLYHASLDGAEYRQLLDANDFDIVDMVAEDPTCGGRTVWLGQRR